MTALRQQGINALKAGNKDQARQLLQMAVDENPQDAQAWLWLSGAAESDQERLECLKTVLRLDPNNAVAAKGIAKLVASGNLEMQLKPAEAPAPSMPFPTPRPAKSRAPRVIFESRPSFIPLVIVAVLTFIILGLFGWFLSAVASDFSRLLFLGMFCLLSLWAFAQLFFALIRTIVSRYTLTTRHLIVRSGVFSLSKKTIPLTKIQDVSIDQHFLFRPFGVGSIIVESAGEFGQTKLRALAHCE